MTTPTSVDLCEAWARRGADPTTGELTDLGRAVLNLIADGRPASVEELAARTGAEREQIQASVAAATAVGYEVEDGAIVGAALTLRPTPHEFRIRGRQLFTWCGFDALFLPMLLQEPAEVASTCPVSGTPIHLTVEADGSVSRVDPGSTVAGIVGDEVMACCSTTGPDSEICTQMPFFADRQAGEQWQATHQDVAIVDLDVARRVARAYVTGRSVSEG